MFLDRKSKRKSIIILIFLLFFIEILVGCGKTGNTENENVSKSIFLLNTYITVTLYSDDQALWEMMEKLIKEFWIYHFLI